MNFKTGPLSQCCICDKNVIDLINHFTRRHMDVQDMEQGAPEGTTSVHNVKTKNGSSFTVRGCEVVIYGLACKLCTFKCTDKKLMKNHIDAKHSNIVKVKNEFRNPGNQKSQSMQRSFLHKQSYNNSPGQLIMSESQFNKMKDANLSCFKASFNQMHRSNSIFLTVRNKSSSP